MWVWVKERELHSEDFKARATPEAFRPQNLAKPPLFKPDDHRLSKHFQMSLRAVQGTASAAWTKQSERSPLGKEKL